MFNRIESLIGINNVEKIKKSKVLIIGLGGVGGSALESLVRSGIENITIVDFDVLDETNLNRQIIALNSTIGMKKTDAFYNRIMDINPNCKVKIIDEYINEKNIDKIFEDIEYVIDACDTINTKKLIIKNCLDRKIKFISCMGTAKKLDPTQLQITDIRKTSYDKLAKIIRKWASENKINKKIPVVSSTEKIIENKDNSKSLASMCFVPNTAGILCAKYIIDEIIRTNN
ncbi:MAG: ThiF family adenylyltransferase [Bacilli bacterium]|nr:ThiF family adenylyltransferase [Bacilli bacterium]